MAEVPVGFRFIPTDDELINFFLLKKLRRESLPHDSVKDCDLYSSEPWNLFDKNAHQVFHVFVKLNKLNKSKSMTKRTAGSGTWNGQNKVKLFDRDGRHIGLKKLFRFKDGKTSTDDNNGSWIMYELSSLYSDDLVVCRIRNKDLDKLVDNNHPKKRSRDSVVIDANPVFVLPQGDNVVREPQSYGHINGTDMIQVESIQDRNFSSTPEPEHFGVEPVGEQLVDYNTHQVHEYQNFSSTKNEHSVINANPDFVLTQGDNVVREPQSYGHIPGTDLIQVVSIQDRNFSSREPEPEHFGVELGWRRD